MKENNKRTFIDLAIWNGLSRMLKENTKAKTAHQITLMPNGTKLHYIVIKAIK